MRVRDCSRQAETRLGRGSGAAERAARSAIEAPLSETFRDPNSAFEKEYLGCFRAVAAKHRFSKAGATDETVGITYRTNAAERALRGFALGRKSWLFAGSDRGADCVAFMATLIMSAKLNDIDPQAWLADVLADIADTPISRLEQLLPWNWTPKTLNAQAA